MLDVCRERDRRDVPDARQERESSEMGAEARTEPEGMMGSALLYEPADRT